MRKALPLALVGAALLLNGCASIVSKSRWPVSISSAPSEADIVIVDQRGREVAKGKTPTVVHLRSGAGFFTKAEYVVTFTKPGYDTKQLSITADLNGWYLGNLVFGGLIGFLIVDPATGAMYKIEQRDVQALLVESGKTQLLPTPGELRIMSIDEVPAELQGAMVRVQ
ncbi:hypothetical protein [Hymenobacter sp. B81]|uniref:hypothetical protein n=1 Tax=Hymenobacter sp. B81 TaxID=3344878 RepID=UPI0037DC70A8